MPILCCDSISFSVVQVCHGQEHPQRHPRDGGGGSHRHLGGHRRPGEREEGAAGAGPVPRRAPGEVPQVRDDAVTRGALLRTARVRQDPAGQGHRQRVSGQLHLHQGPRAAHHVVRRVRGQRQGCLRQGTNRSI